LDRSWFIGAHCTAENLKRPARGRDAELLGV